MSVPQPVPSAQVPVRVPLGHQTWQRVVTWVLLGLSVFGFALTMIAPPTPLMFALAGPNAAASQFGTSSTLGMLLTALSWMIVVVFVATWLFSIILLTKRAVAFFVPLMAGVFTSFLAGFALAAPYLGF